MINDNDYLYQYRVVEFITHLFGTTLLTLLPVLFARLTECGLFLLTAI